MDPYGDDEWHQESELGSPPTGFAHGGASDAALMGQGEQRSTHAPAAPAYRRAGQVRIGLEVPPAPHGEDGTTVHGDAGGEWTLEENGDVDDIVFFVSSGLMRRRAEHSEDG
jgi:hypothetical protein